MPYPLPPHHYRVVAAVFKMRNTAHRQLRWPQLTSMFQDHFNFDIRRAASGGQKFIPPASADNKHWPFSRVPFVIPQPKRNTFSPDEVNLLRSKPRHAYSWDKKTFIGETCDNQEAHSDDSNVVGGTKADCGNDRHDKIGKPAEEN